jgi:hypothetical protein
MPYKADTEIEHEDFAPSKYIVSSQHRRKGNPNKSIWTINFDEEIDCFIQTITKNWKNGVEAWGIKLIGTTLQVVGISNDKAELKLAKFVDGTNSNIWHGYPADHMTKSQDRPTTIILKNWVDNGYITKAKMNKIRQGQLCNL